MKLLEIRENGNLVPKSGNYVPIILAISGWVKAINSVNYF